MISDFFTSTVTIYRPTWATDLDGNDYTTEAEVESTFGHLQQSANRELIAELGLSFSKAFTLWCPVTTDVQDGDRIEIEGTRYTVRGRGELTVGNNSHLSLLLERH